MPFFLHPFEAEAAKGLEKRTRPEGRTLRTPKSGKPRCEILKLMISKSSAGSGSVRSLSRRATHLGSAEPPFKALLNFCRKVSAG
jgi:hypothetical protein